MHHQHVMREDAPRFVNHSELHTCAEPRIEPYDRIVASRRREQQIFEIVAENRNGGFLCTLLQCLEKITLDRGTALDSPSPAADTSQPFLAGIVPFTDTEMLSNQTLARVLRQ